MSNTNSINRYAAKLLFQFRTLLDGISNKKRLCEERIIIFKADTPQDALKSAKKRGRQEEFSYVDNGIKVKFEFVGVQELIELGASFELDEVWSSFFEKIEPMENRSKIIPKEHKLRALCPKADKKRLTVPGKSFKKKE